MARIPHYERRVGEAPLPTPFSGAPGPSGLEGVAQGLRDVGDTVAGIAIAEQERDAAREATNLENELQKTATPLLAEYTQRPGDQALRNNEYDNVVNALEEKRQQLLESASPRAAAVFDARSRGKIESYRATVIGHAAQQRTVAEQDTLEATKKASLDGLAYAYADPAARAKLKAAPEGPMLALGRSEAGRAQSIADWRREFHGKVLDFMLIADRDPEGAAKYLAANAGELGQDFKRYEHTIGVATRAKQADDLATYYLDKSRMGDEDGWADPLVALERTNDIGDLQTRQEVQEALKAKIGVAEEVKKKKILGTGDDVFSSYLTGGYAAMLRDRSTEIDWLKRRAPDEWRKIQLAIRTDTEYWRRLRESGEGTTEAQKDAYLEFERSLIFQPDRYGKEYGAPQLRSEWRHRLSPKQYDRAAAELVRHQANVEKGLGVNMSEFRVAVDAAFAASGGEGKEERAALEAPMAMWLNQQFRDGKTPSRKEMDEEVARQIKLYRYETWGGLGSSEKPLYLVPPGKRPGAKAILSSPAAEPAPVPAVEDALNSGARAALQRAGIKNPTPEQIAAVRARVAGGP